MAMKRDTKKVFKDQAQKLWKDENSYKKRLGIALYPCFTILFILVFFGPLDIFISNSQFINTTVHSVLIPFALILVIFTILLSLAIACLRGKIYNFAIYILFSSIVALYIQGNFLNLDLGALDGKEILWHQYTREAILNFCIWAIIFAIVFFALYLFDKYKYLIVKFVCLVLVALQTTALVVGIINFDYEPVFSVSGEREYTISKNKNIVIILLDSLSNVVLQKAFEINNELQTSFNDFTYYDNCNVGYQGTMPGFLYTLTGHEYNFDLTYEENFNKAWQQCRNAYNMIKNQDYEILLYTKQPKYLAGNDLSRIEGIFDNVKRTNANLINEDAILKFCRLSFYRYVPQMLKPSFWMYSGDLVVEEKKKDIIETDYKFISELRNKGITCADTDKNCLSIIFLDGPHRPFNVDASGNYSEIETDKNQQGAGYLKAVVEYLDNLKKLGKYDESIIILTADHGSNDNKGRQCVFMIKESGMHKEQLTINHSPISQSDIIPTVLSLLQLPYEKYGVTIFDCENIIDRKRSYYYWNHDPNYPETNGKYNVMYQYDYVGDETVLDKKVKNGQCDQVHVLVDSFYN